MSDLLDVREAAEYLALNDQTVRRLSREGKIPCVKVGGTWRYRLQELENWLGRNQTSSSGPVAHGRGKKIRIVDDDPRILHNLAQMLEMEGFEVFSNRDGSEVMQLSLHDIPDLLILDVNMPVNGVDTLLWVRQQWGSVPVIMMTGFPDTELAMKALVHSPITLIKKPIEMEKFVDLVHQMCR